MKTAQILLISMGAALFMAGTAVAAPAQDAIKACKVAVEESVGNDVLSKLTITTPSIIRTYFTSRLPYVLQASTAVL